MSSALNSKPLLKKAIGSVLVFLILIPVFFAAVSQAQGAVINQILAVVDDHLITQSDLQIQELFSLEFPLLDASEKEIHLQYAIDQVLFLEDAEKFATDKPTDQEINVEWKRIESKAGSAEQLKLLLSREGIGENDLRALIGRFLLTKKFVDQRINYFIFIADSEIDSYYNEHLSEWNGAPIEKVRNTIYSILFEDKRKKKLEEFLTKRRAKASIRINSPYSAVGS